MCLDSTASQLRSLITQALTRALIRNSNWLGTLPNPLSLHTILSVPGTSEELVNNRALPGDVREGRLSRMRQFSQRKGAAARRRSTKIDTCPALFERLRYRSYSCLCASPGSEVRRRRGSWLKYWRIRRARLLFSTGTQAARSQDLAPTCGALRVPPSSLSCYSSRSNIRL